MPMTEHPSLSRRRQRWDPMNPAAPGNEDLHADSTLRATSFMRRTAAPGSGLIENGVARDEDLGAVPDEDFQIVQVDASVDFEPGLGAGSDQADGGDPEFSHATTR